MSRYVVRRLLASVPAIIGVLTVVFFALHLIPGDPIMIMFEEQGASAEQIEKLRELYGLNDPIHVQYWRFVTNAVQGDLGRSMRTGMPVLETIKELFPATLELTLASMAVALVVGFTLGTIAALKQHTIWDYGAMAVALTGISMPSFWVALMAIFLFGVRLHWLPTSGQGTLAKLLMPAVILGVRPGAVISRMVRSCLLDVLSADYIRTARAKGLSERAVVIGHALKNALIPVVTIVGLQVGSLLSGAVIIEVVFARQGVGLLTVNAILKRDFPLVQGMILFTSIVFVFSNLAVDILYSFLDPRIRYE